MDQVTLDREQLQALLAVEKARAYELALRQRDSLAVPPLEPTAVYQPVNTQPQKFDPIAQRLMGGGVLMAGIGGAAWGLSLFMDAVARATTGLGFLAMIVGGVVFLVKSPRSGTPSSGTNVTVNVRQTTRL